MRDRFRAFQVSTTSNLPELGGPERRDSGRQSIEQQVVELTTADLPEGDVLVLVEWSAINYKDGMVALAGNRVARISPLVPGVDLAGTVVASDHPEVAVGTGVLVHGHDLGTARHGGFAELARVPGDWVVPLPEGLTARHAMVIGTAGFTAALSLRQLERRGLAPGEGDILVTGASGGVGSMAVALLASRGYRVVASSGKRDERDYLIGLGASAVIGREEVATPNDRALGPERWAGAIDCVGGATLSEILRTLRYGAAVAASGLTGGNELTTTVYPFIVRDVALLGIDSVLTPMVERRAVWQELAGAYSAATLDAMVADEVGLDGVATSLTEIQAGRVSGRILVQPSR